MPKTCALHEWFRIDWLVRLLRSILGGATHNVNTITDTTYYWKYNAKQIYNPLHHWETRWARQPKHALDLKVVKNISIGTSEITTFIQV